MSDDAVLKSGLGDAHSRIAALAAESKGYRLKAKEYRSARDAVAKERDDLKAQLDALTKERDDFKTRLEAAPGDQQKEIDRLRGEIRTRDHRAVFNRLAKAANVRDEALDDLWQLTGYQAEADQADEATITGLIGDALKARTYLVQTPAAAGTTAAATPPAVPGPGGVRGAPSTDSGGMTVTHAQLQDAVWMLNNQARMAKAQEAGSLTIVEG